MLPKLGRKVRFAWEAARFCARMMLEHVATMWLLGIAPFLAHLGTAAWRSEYSWIPNDLYPFVMVIGAKHCYRSASKTGDPTDLSDRSRRSSGRLWLLAQHALSHRSRPVRHPSASCYGMPLYERLPWR
jgi:hypothetical protein